MNPESKRTILIASIGTSPRVLTNAVWALAHQKESSDMVTRLGLL